MQAIFQLDFNKRTLKDILRFEWIDYEIPDEEKEFAGKLIKGVVENTESIDKIIMQYSENWKMERISAVNRAILRISIFQLMHYRDVVPVKVTIDEAIKISKKYGDPDSGRFINGVLDAYRKDVQGAEKKGDQDG